MLSEKTIYLLFRQKQDALQSLLFVAGPNFR